MANPNATAEPLVLEAKLKQLGRALENPNCAASVPDSPENLACLQQIKDVRAAITAAQTPAP